MVKYITFVLAHDKYELDELINEENVHITFIDISFINMLKFLKRNPRLKRVEFPEYFEERFKQKAIKPNNDIVLLLRSFNIKIIFRNIRAKRPVKINATYF